MAKTGSKKGSKKGNGYVYQQRPGGNYYLQYVVDGKRKTQSLKTKNRKQAEKIASEYLTPAIHAKSKEQVLLSVAEARKLVKKSSLAIADAWNVYEKSQGRPDSSKGTLGNYKRNWTKFVEFCQENYPLLHSISDITADVAEAFFKNLDESKISSSTYNYYRGALTLIFKIVSRQENITENPFAHIGPKKVIQQTRKALTSSELLQLIAAFGKPELKLCNKEQMRILFCTGIYTGLRLIDCVNIRWEDIDLSNKIISLIPAKTSRQNNISVTIPVHPDLHSYLKEAEEWRDDTGYVIPAVAERYSHNPSGVRKDAVKVFRFEEFDSKNSSGKGEQRKVQRNEYGFHSLRHSFATICAESGVPIIKLSTILGDNTKTLEKYYVKLHAEAVKDVVDSLPSLKVDQEVKSSQLQLNQIPASQGALPVATSKEDYVQQAIAILQAADDLTEREAEVLALLNNDGKTGIL